LTDLNVVAHLFHTYNNHFNWLF